MYAEFDSDCDYCGEDIEEGDKILRRDGWGWIHDYCAEAFDEEATNYDKRNAWNI